MKVWRRQTGFRSIGKTATSKHPTSKLLKHSNSTHKLSSLPPIAFSEDTCPTLLYISVPLLYLNYINGGCMAPNPNASQMKTKSSQGKLTGNTRSSEALACNYGAATMMKPCSREAFLNLHVSGGDHPSSPSD